MYASLDVTRADLAEKNDNTVKPNDWQSCNTSDENGKKQEPCGRKADLQSKQIYCPGLWSGQ